jgi:DNA-binding transcriptional LysR family regulator
MSFDTFSLQCFISVAETGSFTKAAERVRRTQSAVSQQIAKLEKALGHPLIIRAKNLSLTPQGEVFLGYARKIFTLHSEAMDRFKEPELAGEVRFGLPEDFVTFFLSDVLADFSRIHPRITLNIECDLTLNLYDRFKNKEFDLVLVKMNSPKDFPNGVEVWSEPLRWVGDKNLIEINNPVPLVLSPHPCVYRTSAISALENAKRTWRIIFTSPSYAGTLAAVRAGMGITIMPNHMIPEDLHAIPASLLPKLLDNHVSILKDLPDNPAVNSLEEFIVKKLK